jgi:hypothetical protein
MVQRLFTIDLPQGTASLEQTDYGHPGRFNPPQARKVPPAWQPRTAQLVATAESLGLLLGSSSGA